MKVEFEYDQDPRYGWASIDIGEKTNSLIIVHSLEYGSRGFEFRNGKITPTCICSAWNEGECACPGVDWHTTDEDERDG
jgi:hypothetical protein